MEDGNKPPPCIYCIFRTGRYHSDRAKPPRYCTVFFERIMASTVSYEREQTTTILNGLLLRETWQARYHLDEDKLPRFFAVLFTRDTAITHAPATPKEKNSAVSIIHSSECALQPHPDQSVGPDKHQGSKVHSRVP